MSRKLRMGLAAALLTTAAVTATVLAGGNEPANPLTSSPQWRAVSDDVGMLLREDETFGLRARLYVKVKGEWRAVATDGAADLTGAVPVKK